MTTYYRGTAFKKIGDYDIGLVGRSDYYRFFTTDLQVAKSYGPIVMRVDIDSSKTYTPPVDRNIDANTAKDNWLKKWGLYEKWSLLPRKTGLQWEKLIFDEAKKRGYDAVIWDMQGGQKWCIPLKPDIVKIRDVLSFQLNPGGYVIRKGIGGKKKYSWKLKPTGKIPVGMVMGR